MSPLILAHGLGGRSDLPVPLWLALYGGAAAVVVSFAALGAFWREPKLKGEAGGRALPRSIQKIVDSRAIRALVRAFGVCLWLFTMATAGVGSSFPTSNPAPTLLYVWFWVGLVPASLLLGPVWRAVNPLRGLSQLLFRLSGSEELQRDELPRWTHYWPAAASLLVFVWLELVYADAAEPTTVLGFVALYSLFHVAAANVYGMRWYERGDGFEVYSTLVGRLSFLGRRGDGRLVVRNPFDGLAGLRAEPGLVAVITVLLGSTAFDGLTRTRFWIDLTQGRMGAPYLLLGTAGLVAAIGAIALTYLAAVRFSARYQRSQETEHGLATVFIHSLIPIAIGYTVAHYFSLFIFRGQAGYILSSDPFGTGLDLFGTRDWSINYLLVSTSAIALVQVGAIVSGHIAGVVAAHDRALEVFSDRDKTRAQYSLLAVMVTYTVCGIALLVGT